MPVSPVPPLAPRVMLAAQTEPRQASRRTASDASVTFHMSSNVSTSSWLAIVASVNAASPTVMMTERLAR
jgi:hypothetical protein